jgi:uncharacterized membrane protein YqjE
MHDVRPENQARSLGAILSDIANELKEFVNTRIQMIKAELHETVVAVSVAIPLGLAALILAATGFLLLTGAVVALVAAAFVGSPYAWVFAFAIVGAVWIAFGGVAAFFAYNEFRSKSMFPKHTVEVLKADKVWLESEARTKYGRVA